MRGSADRAAPSTCSGVATPKYPIDIRVAGGLFEGDVELLDRATIVALADVCGRPVEDGERAGRTDTERGVEIPDREVVLVLRVVDRKSTRLNSSHGYISYAVFCL